MKASEAIRLCARSETPDDNNEQGCLRVTGMLKKYVEQDCVSAFPLLYSTPIFLFNDVAKDCPFWDLLPEEIRPRDAITNIVFLIDFVDYARCVKRWPLVQIADLIEKIENQKGARP
jgi:hypothetical protein